MLIIAEGPDGSGKSTLVTSIRRAINELFPDDQVNVLHKGPPTDTPIHEYEQPLYSYRPEQERHIICDRWHIGEWVYPHVLNRSTRADDANLWHIEAFLASRGAVLVYAQPDSAVIAANVTARGDDLVTALQTTEIVTGYQAQIARTILPVYRYDYTQNSPEFFAPVVVRQAAWRADATKILSPFTTYVGPPDPQILLLGDVRHELRDRALFVDDDTTPYGAAFGPEAGTSGHYLLSHLPSSLRRIAGLANACDVDDVNDLRETLGYPHTVALGTNAYRTLKSRVTGPDPGMPFGAVPHPQYIRRFHHKHGAAYGRLIADVARTPRDETRWRPVSPNTPPISRKKAA